MNKKYFFFDIDGTLTDRKTGLIIPSAKEALHKLQEAGHFVALATGRSFYKASPFCTEQGVQYMVCNGGNGIVIDGVLQENKPLDYQKALALYHEARQLGYGVLVAADDSEQVFGCDFLFYHQAGERREPTTYLIDPAFQPEQLDEIYKIYISISTESEKQLTLLDTLGHLRFEQEYLMFQPDAKKNGIIRMIELVDGDIKEVVVFGDDDNDLNMFDEQFYCIAMGNACEKLKKQADFITLTNSNHGIYHACQRHKWF